MRRAMPARDQLRVGVGGGGDDDGIGGVQQRLDRRERPRADLRRYGGRALRLDIGDEQLIHPVEGSQQPRMHGSDTPSTDQTDPHRWRLLPDASIRHRIMTVLTLICNV